VVVLVCHLVVELVCHHEEVVSDRVQLKLHDEVQVGLHLLEVFC
jgi:hypothetical protein